MKDIKVHVLNFHSINSHIELVLENTSTTPHTYYGINRWTPPSDRWYQNGPKSYIDQASSTYSFMIKADPNEIISEWTNYWMRTENKASILGENCAVAAQKFLTQFANIPAPSLSNFSLNHVAMGIVWPSFIPCPVTLPGRIMSNAKYHAKKMANEFSSISDLPSEHNNRFKIEIINVAKQFASSDQKEQQHVLHRLNALGDFVNQLNEVDVQAKELRKNNHIDAADCADELVNNMINSAKNFVTDKSENAYENFKNDTTGHIKKARPTLEKHQGWKRILGNLALAIIGVGVLYAIAGGIKAAVTGDFLFFNNRSVNRVNKVKKSISHISEREQAFNAMPLRKGG